MIHMPDLKDINYLLQMEDLPNYNQALILSEKGYK